MINDSYKFQINKFCLGFFIKKKTQTTKELHKNNFTNIVWYVLSDYIIIFITK